MRLPSRIARFLFGDYTQVYLLAPGQTVESVDVREIKEGGTCNGKDERTCRANCGA